jgi:hypothetical protein
VEEIKISNKTAWAAEIKEVQEEKPEEKKPIVKRPYLARGAGKAGGIGQVEQKKSKSCDPIKNNMNETSFQVEEKY